MASIFIDTELSLCETKVIKIHRFQVYSLFYLQLFNLTPQLLSSTDIIGIDLSF
jgi:hypothetical protein